MTVEDSSEMIEVEWRAFEETSNPFHAWAAYGLARAVGAPIPEWVLQYFDLAMRRLFNISAEGVDIGHHDKPALIARALDFDGQVFTQYRKDWMVLGGAVNQRTATGTQESAAIDEVAERYASSPATVRRAYKRYKRLYPGQGIFPDQSLS